MTAKMLKVVHTICRATAAELEVAKQQRRPMHCQTMARKSRRYPWKIFIADAEELDRPRLDRLVTTMERRGWRRIGTYYTRTLGRERTTESAYDSCKQ